MKIKRVIRKIKRILKFKIDWVYFAQAHGCWLYIQIGNLAIFCGTHCKCGIRIEFRRWKYENFWRYRFQFRRFE